MSDIKEEKFNAMVKLALYEQMEQEMAKEEIPSVEHEFSKEFEKKMNRLIKKTENKRTHYRKWKTTAAVGLITVVAAGVITMNVDALRLPVLNLITGQRYATLGSNKGAEQVEIPQDYVDYVPSYVPEGFELVYAYGDEDMGYMEYVNGEKEYHITIVPNEEQTDFDTEDGKIKEIEVAGKQIIVLEKEGKLWATHTKFHHAIIVDGELKIEDIQLILNSIK